MKQRPSKEQILDALQTYKTHYRAARKLGVSYPTVQKWMRQYGIEEISTAKAKPEVHEPWYKRFWPWQGK